jgi:hypothetical protein
MHVLCSCNSQQHQSRESRNKVAMDNEIKKKAKEFKNSRITGFIVPDIDF